LPRRSRGTQEICSGEAGKTPSRQLKVAESIDQLLNFQCGKAKGEKTMIRSLTNFVVMIGFTLLLPLFCFAAWGWGSFDEKWLMKVCFCVLGPFCFDFWYLIVRHIVLRKDSSYLVQFMIFVLGYSGVYFLLKSGMVRF
jgi:hypothetical protein